MPRRGWGRPEGRPAGRGQGHGRTVVKSAPKPEETAQRRFAEACAQIQVASQKHTANYDLSDSEEEEVDEQTRKHILGKICADFTTDDGLGNTNEYIQKALNGESNTCLICIGTVKRTDPIWCCDGCYVGFHLTCIQTWARDSIAQKQLRLDNGDGEQHTQIDWNCPNCRAAYDSGQIPSRYRCFCGQRTDPPLDPWLLPHTCGERCGKLLRPKCGHTCLLHCHPGPCPPCPVTVSTSCYCGNTGPQPKRCAYREWSCGKPCNKLLDCKAHKCSEPCHQGVCPPCPRTSRQSCCCGRQQRLQPCDTPVWQCEEVCGRPLACGNHTCAVRCHAGACAACPLAGPRRCPCGRTEASLPCDQTVPPCGDTCEKLLACGVHRCVERCHTGKCGRCLQLRVKRCRCGRKEKELVCDKEFTCDVKCKKLKSCGKHTCNRKCCVGDCPPCEQTCGRSLTCGQHKCSSPCHTGPCYPCPLSVVVSCACGGTSVTVPCGRQRATRPPRCRRPCPVPPDCHHPARQPHPCHLGPCPKCSQPCGRRLQGCGHTCPLPCHDRVTRPLPNQKPAATPWEKTEQKFITVSLPCPPCQVPVSVTCLGGHADYPLPCERARPEPCGRPCARLLACGNHRCQQSCHLVEDAPDSTQAGGTCDTCELPCAGPRPAGCQHPCPRPCHPGPCPPCREHRRVRCHCQISLLHVRCHQLTEAGLEQTEILLSCGNTCPKLYACGHRCVRDCHSGECRPPADGCPGRVRLRCACGRRARTAACRDLPAGKLQQLDCDDVCAEKLALLKQEREAREREAAAEEEARRRREVEELERKLERGRRKRRVRRTVDTEAPAGWSLRARLAAAAAAALAVTLAAVYVVFQ